MVNLRIALAGLFEGLRNALRSLFLVCLDED